MSTNTAAQLRHDRIDREMARTISSFIVSCGRDVEGWDTNIAEVLHYFPTATLRAYVWALQRVS